MEYVSVDLREHEFVEILPLSDLHVGHPQFDPFVFDNALKWLNGAENRFAVLNGDAFENALKDSKGDPYTTMSPREELNFLRKKLIPLKHKFLAATRGNHEEREVRNTSQDSLETLAFELDIPYSPAGMVIDFRVGKRPTSKNAFMYSSYWLHGWGGGRKPGAALNNITSLVEVLDADLYVTSHVHKPVVHRDARMVIDAHNRKIKPRERVYVITASMLGYAQYAEQKGMRPTSTRFPIIKLSGKNEWGIEVSL